ncbi:MAG: hypothetical protein JSW54_00680 [Fidelibacterota bacterium]|nr:MAG: hypothetical protein JSW54_00680 [Candidatus Neomarinimicrobiota bacterium]
MLKTIFAPGLDQFPGSKQYWEKRYIAGETSGDGSCGQLGAFKAEILNAFVKQNDIHSIIEFRCDDGHQLSLAEYPKYIGLDVSRKAMELCRERFRDDRSESFFLYDPEAFADQHGIFTAEPALSLDVIFHLVEDHIYQLHMQHLFAAAERYVTVYSSNVDRRQTAHERHRQFSTWVDTNMMGWTLQEKIPSKFPYDEKSGAGSLSDVFI